MKHLMLKHPGLQGNDKTARQGHMKASCKALGARASLLIDKGAGLSYFYNLFQN